MNSDDKREQCEQYAKQLDDMIADLAEQVADHPEIVWLQQELDKLASRVKIQAEKYL